MSKVQMSEAVGISPSRCYERMRRLEHAEIIRGYHADIDIARLASCLQFQVQIKLLNYTDARAREFEKTVLRLPEIISCHAVLGHVDYVIGVVASTLERYQEVITQLRQQSGNDFDFVTFPVSKAIKTHHHSDFKQIVGRLSREDASAC
jgi:Lrp/AsnC family transcriptional regulator of ectoine degradation